MLAMAHAKPLYAPVDGSNRTQHEFAHLLVVTDALKLLEVKRELSLGLRWLYTEGNQIRRSDTDATTLLRGVNRSGLEYSAPQQLTLRRRAGSREIANLCPTCPLLMQRGAWTL
jgi:hypothetical protein